jgi:hypothetical protein
MVVVVVELHSSSKWVVSTYFQLSYNELHYIYSELQFCNSCNLFDNTHNVETLVQNTPFSHSNIPNFMHHCIGDGKRHHGHHTFLQVFWIVCLVLWSRVKNLGLPYLDILKLIIDLDFVTLCKVGFLSSLFDN